MIRMIALSAVALALLPLTVLGITIEGSRETPPESGIEATGGWADWDPNGSSGGLRLDWNISQDTPESLWYYKYTFTDLDGTGPDPEISHWILQVSDVIDSQNYEQYFFTFSGPVEFGHWTADLNPLPASSPGDNNGNPNLPGDIHGLKFELGPTPTTFWSSQYPVWGSFYAKDGNGGSQGVTTAWNPGLEGLDGGYDLTDITNWIPTPDTGSVMIPEPTATVLALMALVAGAVARRRRRKEGEDA